jgi:hypothetical protein
MSLKKRHVLEMFDKEEDERRTVKKMTVKTKKGETNNLINGFYIYNASFT